MLLDASVKAPATRLFQAMQGLSLAANTKEWSKQHNGQPCALWLFAKHFHPNIQYPP